MTILRLKKVDECPLNHGCYAYNLDSGKCLFEYQCVHYSGVSNVCNSVEKLSRLSDLSIISWQGSTSIRESHETLEIKNASSWYH